MMHELYEDFQIKITEDNRILSMTSDATVIGSQYDNEAQRLVFERPERFMDMELILYFAPMQQYGAAGIAMEPVNIGTVDEWVMTSDITRYPKIRMQIAFMQNGVELEHSNVITLEFRKSISPKATTVPSILSRISTLESNAFVSMSYQDDTLTMSTSDGDQQNVQIVGKQGPPGPQGRDGVDGSAGSPGSNEVSPATATSGFLCGGPVYPPERTVSCSNCLAQDLSMTKIL